MNSSARAVYVKRTPLLGLKLVVEFTASGDEWPQEPGAQDLPAIYIDLRALTFVCIYNQSHQETASQLPDASPGAGAYLPSPQILSLRRVPQRDGRGIHGQKGWRLIQADAASVTAAADVARSWPPEPGSVSSSSRCGSQLHALIVATAHF